jgi:anti-anti-sigma regulatory factor
MTLACERLQASPGAWPDNKPDESSPGAGPDANGHRLAPAAMTAQQLVHWLQQRPTVQIDPRIRTSMPAEPELASSANIDLGDVATRTRQAHDHRTEALDVAVATDFATGIVDVTARGTLDLSTAPVVRSAVIKAAAEEPSCIVVDLNGTVITDKRAAGVFLALAGRLSESMIGFAVHIRPGDTADLLQRMLLGFVPVREDRPDAIAALAHPGPGYRRLRMHLMPVPTAPAQARALVDLACVNWGLRVDQDIARLVVSELVTNVVDHGSTDLDVSLVRAGAHLIVQVTDRSTVLDTKTSDGMGTEHVEGWDLELVDANAAGWGFHAADTGTTVWATLRLADDPDRK